MEKCELIIPGQTFKAIDTVTRAEVSLLVETLTNSGRVVLSPNHRRSVVVKPEDLVDALANGGYVDGFQFIPLVPQSEQS